MTTMERTIPESIERESDKGASLIIERDFQT